VCDTDLISVSAVSTQLAYQLQDGEVLLPPEVFSNVRAQSCQTVVSIHEHVNEAVGHCRKEGC